MIRLLLFGRTGNILFQYALGRVLAERHGVPLLLDAAWYDRNGWRDVREFLALPLKAVVRRRLSLPQRILRNATKGKHYLEYSRVEVLRENPADQRFCPAFLSAPADCFLMGYFQSHRYFAGIDALLRAELLQCLGGVGLETVPGLGEPDSVAVHVRRGDFLRLPAFGVCDLSYYRRAMGRMREMVPGARFHVFSDDPAWCREALAGPDVVVVSREEGFEGPLRDLTLMSRAAHHIICNSSFSWWAAWLGKRDGQRVLMPNRWYARDVIAPIAEKQYPGWEMIDPD